MNEKDIIDIIKSDPWMMEVLGIARSLGLKDWAIGAGFVRNKIWDHLSGKVSLGVDTPDIDLVYYDKNGNDEVSDQILSKELNKKTGYNWEIVNQNYSHVWNKLDPYISTEDAISKWPETVTAIGVNIDKQNDLHLVAPYGISDLINFIVKPTPAFIDKVDILKGRVLKKKWLEKWPRIVVREI